MYVIYLQWPQRIEIREYSFGKFLDLVVLQTPVAYKQHLSIYS